MKSEFSTKGETKRFNIVEGYSFDVLNSFGLASRLQSLFDSESSGDGGQSICAIQTTSAPNERLTIDFATFGPGCRIECHPDVRISELLNWINILLPAADVVSMHASAFTWKGLGVTITGNANSGKTGALLAAINRGGKAIGDECLWLDRQGRLRGLFVDMEIRADYFREIPFLRSEVSMPALVWIYLCDLIGRSISPVQPWLSRKFKGRARAHLRADIIKRHLDRGASMDRLYVSEVKEGAKVRVTQASLSEIVPRLLDIQMTEFSKPFDRYHQYQRLSSSRQNPWMDSLEKRMASLFTNALEDTQCFILERPPSISANKLFGAIDENWG